MWELQDSGGKLLATVYSAAMTYLVYTALLNAGYTVTVIERTPY